MDGVTIGRLLNLVVINNSIEKFEEGALICALFNPKCQFSMGTNSHCVEPQR